MEDTDGGPEIVSNVDTKPSGDLDSIQDTPPALSCLSPALTTPADSKQENSFPDLNNMTLTVSCNEDKPLSSSDDVEDEESDNDDFIAMQSSSEEEPPKTSCPSVPPEPVVPDVPVSSSANATSIVDTSNNAATLLDSSFYTTKAIRFQGSLLPIVTQNENGPCPLIALTNVLLLRRKIRLSANGTADIVTGRQLVSIISDFLIETAPTASHIPTDHMRNYEQNINDAFTVFPKLQTGLDVNVRFTGVSDFEYTPELCVFDLMHVPLYHGWIVDPQEEQTRSILGNHTYNQLVEIIINSKSSSDQLLLNNALLAENFLERTASQLTFHGLVELTSTVKENELAVLFRNNHFSTIYKKDDCLYALVTDVSLMDEPRIVWEVLNDVDGDTQFVDSDLSIYVPPPVSSIVTHSTQSPGIETSTSPSVTNTSESTDYQLAQRLQREQSLVYEANDRALAEALQAEEDAQYRRDLQNQESVPPPALEQQRPPPSHQALPQAHQRPPHQGGQQRTPPPQATGHQRNQSSSNSGTNRQNGSSESKGSSCSIC